MGPNAIGFVFWSKSKRYVRPEQVATWLPSIPEGIRKVGVFVEPKAADVEAIARLCQLDVIQIHLRSNDWKMDRPLFEGLEVWLSPRMSSDVDKEVLEHIFPEPTALLADSFDAGSIGGTGRVGNWDRAISMKEDFGKPVLLAGGLNPDNVAEAMDAVEPWGIDVSSGVEKEPGVKDLKKVKKFIAAVRGDE